MGVYDGLNATSVALIAKYGKSVTLFSEPTTPADPNKPWRGSSRDENNWTKKTVKGVEDEWEKEEVDGDRVRYTDLKVLVAAGDPALVGLDPEVVTGADMEGVRYAALRVGRVKPGDVNLVLTYRLRKC